jgi:hypothetical protein
LRGLFGGFNPSAIAAEIDAGLKDLSKTGKTKTWLKKIVHVRGQINDAHQQAPADPVLAPYYSIESLLDTGRVHLEASPNWTKIISQFDDARAYLAPEDDDTLKALRRKLKG